ncbi:uncharacterized protein [Primulina huaijiensis]|uniref:uncharacterized protein n=1 Tax=Primulina huaijiensis TaxID=1492673 RepID=UPI003CC76D1F
MCDALDLRCWLYSSFKKFGARFQNLVLFVLMFEGYPEGFDASGVASDIGGHVLHEVDQEPQIPPVMRSIRNIEVDHDVEQLIKVMGEMELVIYQFQNLRPPRFFGTEDDESCSM